MGIPERISGVLGMFQGLTMVFDHVMVCTQVKKYV